MMWQFLESKLTGIIISGVLIGVAYMLGVNHGANRTEKIYAERELQIQIAHNLQLKKWQSIAESSQQAYYRQKESDTKLYQGLWNEYQTKVDNLNTCELSNHRLRGILSASKNSLLLPGSASGSKTESIGKSADISGMTCNGLYKSYLACAEKYASCYNGYNQLWQWSNKVGSL